jgi:ankyrin repeat protein
VKGGASLSLVNKDGWTPFHIACREGHSDIIEFLLDTSPGCWDTVSRNGRTPLHTAALHGKLETVRILLDRCGCKPDSVDSSGVTPLMDAAQGNHQEVAQCLLHHHKGCLKMEDSQGRQAIHHASQAGATDALQLLLTEGAEVDALASMTGLTPLHYAAKVRVYHVVRSLVVKCRMHTSTHHACGRLLHSYSDSLTFTQLQKCRCMYSDYTQPVLCLHTALPTLISLTFQELVEAFSLALGTCTAMIYYSLRRATQEHCLNC